MFTTIEIKMRFDADDADPSHFEGFLDAVADEFATLGLDVDYTASLANLSAVWVMDVPDASEESFIGALSNLRTALHAVGCHTAGWPTKHEIVSTSARNLTHA